MGAKYPDIITTKIKYDSPSGWVCIGKYIPPFKKNSKGFGYEGVLVEDLKTGKLQCAICGGWFKNLGRHIGSHKLKSVEYKEQNGLLKSTALISKDMRLQHSKDMIKYRKTNPKYRRHFSVGNSESGNTKGKHIPVEKLNRLGICDLQIVARIIKLAKKLNKTPTLIDLGEEYGNGFISILSRKYDSYIKICHENGLEPNIPNPYAKKYKEIKEEWAQK